MLKSRSVNMRLSQRRAENVMKYLVDQFGINRSRLIAKGYGSTRRIAYNNTHEGRLKKPENKCHHRLCDQEITARCHTRRIHGHSER